MDIEERRNLQIMACKVRLGILEAVYNAKSGHPGGSLSVADIITYLYFNQMKVDPENPKWEERDRLVLSKGHVAPALYSVLAHKGFFEVELLKSLRKVDSILQGHPSMHLTPGVDMSTGSLGQGLSVAAGMALAAKLKGASYKTYAILGDGEIQEGQIWEAAMFAGAKGLDSLIAVLDNNDLQIDGSLEEVNSPYPIAEKFVAFGWHLIEIDAHDFDQIDSAFKAAANNTDKPTLILAKSVKGKGVSFMEDNYKWHGTAPNAEQYEQAVAEVRDVLSSLEVENE
ncbi:MAG: transketolase [Clostridiales bacterium]|nr:transketolase [Clostridiales bacterium]